LNIAEHVAAEHQLSAVAFQVVKKLIRALRSMPFAAPPFACHLPRRELIAKDLEPAFEMVK
jgi:hypothetical protein